MVSHQTIEMKNLRILLIVYRKYQHGEVFDAGDWSARILGPLPYRHGISATVYGVVHHRDIKAR